MKITLEDVLFNKEAMPAPKRVKPGWKVKESGNLERHEWSIYDKDENRLAQFIIEKNLPSDAETDDDSPVWHVAWSHSTVNGYGIYLYEKAINWCGLHGGHLASDKLVSDHAAPVWEKYYHRDDTEKVPYRRTVNKFDYDADIAGTKPDNSVRTEPALQYKYRLKKHSTPEFKARGTKGASDAEVADKVMRRQMDLSKVPPRVLNSEAFINAIIENPFPYIDLTKGNASLLPKDLFGYLPFMEMAMTTYPQWVRNLNENLVDNYDALKKLSRVSREVRKYLTPEQQMIVDS